MTSASDSPFGADRSLLRDSAVMTVGTLLSRITGYLRSFLLVAAVGLALHADLFTVANTVPNALYILAAGGVLNAVLVPQLVRSMRTDTDGGTAYANRVLTLVGLVLLVTTTLAVVLAPTLMRLYAPGELYQPELAAQRAALETFARLCLPQIFFYGMYVLVGQVLNARGRFGPMMFAPIANNVVACAMLVLYLVLYEPASGTAPYTTSQQLLLGVGSTLGVAVQALVLIPYLRAVGLRYRPRFDFRGTGLRHTGRLALWTVLFVVVNQIAYLIVTRLAVEGSAAAGLSGDPAAVGATVYQSAYLLVMLPHALITVSLTTALLPRLSAQAAAGRLADLRRDLVSTMRLAVAGAITAGLLLLAVAIPLVRLLFGWGAAAGETRPLGVTVMLFVPGLVAFTIHFVTLRGFYALEDTRTPFLVQCAVAATNVGSALLVSFLIGRPSAMVLAASFSLAYCVGAAISTAALAHRLGGLHRMELGWFLVRASGAAAPAALVAFLAALAGGVAGDSLSGGVESSRLGALIGIVAAGMLAVPTYLVAARLLVVREVAQVLDMVRSRVRRRRRGRSAPAEPVQPPTMVTVNDNEDTVVGLPPFGDGPDDDAPGGPGSPALQPGAGMPPRASSDAGGGAGPAPAVPAGGGPVPTPDVAPGSVIAGRYQLEELLATMSGAATWRGIDEVLSRPVVLHLLRVDDPRAEALTQAARAAASVADPHFLRMLDVSGDDQHVYIVREWVAGRNLAQALVNGPFDAEDATYVVRELAAAMSNAHRSGLSHLRLEPDAVVLADSGQVKVVDVGVDRVLHGTTAADPARADAAGIGRVLYALLTARWPGGPLMGLAAAPTQDGRLCSPRQVLAGVPGQLDEVTDRILGDPPRSHRGPLHTSAQIEEALDQVSGQPTRRHTMTLPPPAFPGTQQPVTQHPATQHPATQHPASQHPASPVPERRHDLEPTAAWHRPDQPPAPVPAPQDRRTGRRVVGAIVAAVLLGGAIVLGYQLAKEAFGREDPAAGPDATPGASSTISGTPTAGGPVRVDAATAYDPVYLNADGVEVGNGEENDALAANAVDEDETTLWTTVNYFDPLEAQKPGVGLLLDLGAVTTVSGVDLTLLAAGGTVELRAAPEDATEVPPTPSDFTIVVTQEGPELETTLTPEGPVQTRYLLVWFTVLPQVDENYKNGVAEAVVLGE